MEFLRFKESVLKTKDLSLDAEKSHGEMWPATRKHRLSEQEIEKREPLHAGVTALFYPDINDSTMIVLIKRRTYKGVHSGQIGFPGGREENMDISISGTALRETEEEVGVRRTNITLIRELSKVYIPPSNFWVHPFLGVVKTQTKFRRQENEVEELLQVKLEEILDPHNVITEAMPLPNGDKVDVPAFSLNGNIVWGATAMMLNEVKSLLTKVL